MDFFQKYKTLIFMAGVGILVFLILMVLLIVLIKRRRKKRSREAFQYLEKTMSPTSLNGLKSHLITVADHSPVCLAKVHSAGKRGSQQDTFGVSDVENETVLMTKGFLGVVADGMGGMENGNEVSAIATVAMLRYFDEETFGRADAELMYRMVQKANDEVNLFLGGDRIGRSGTTMTAVTIQENRLYWLSVGDSAIYFYRDNQLQMLNERHNYMAVLNERVRNGEITEQEAKSDPQRNALTSYIGAGVIEKISQNQEPLMLQRGDRVILMSDGVFGTLSDEQLHYLMHFDVEESALKMQAMIEEKDKRNQDNYTALIVEYRGITPGEREES